MKTVVNTLFKQAWLLGIVVCFTSCMTTKLSTHPGVFTVPRPAMDEHHEEVWRVYYDDQFDALEGNVAMPGHEFPEAAKLGYYNAKKYWDKKVRDARDAHEMNKGVAYVGIGIVALLLLFAVTPTLYMY